MCSSHNIKQIDFQSPRLFNDTFCCHFNVFYCMRVWLKFSFKTSPVMQFNMPFNLCFSGLWHFNCHVKDILLVFLAKIINAFFQLISWAHCKQISYLFKEIYRTGGWTHQQLKTDNNLKYSFVSTDIGKQIPRQPK